MPGLAGSILCNDLSFDIFYVNIVPTLTRVQWLAKSRGMCWYLLAKMNLLRRPGQQSLEDLSVYQQIREV